MFLFGPDYWDRMFGDFRIGFYLSAFASLFLILGAEQVARGWRKRRADRRLRDGLDGRPVVGAGDARPGIVRVRGRVRLREPGDEAFAIRGTCARAFSIVDETGSIDVEPGELMTAWDLGPERATLRDGDLVEAVGFVSEGPPRQGRGYRDAQTTLEMHGRDGVPLYLRPLVEQDTPRVRVEVEDEAIEEAERPVREPAKRAARDGR